MIWHDLRDAKDPELDALAQRYDLHPLHIEDCRHRNQRAKVEEGADYIFVVLKPVHINAAGELEVTDFDLFLGRDYLITVQEGECPSLRKNLGSASSNCQSLSRLTSSFTKTWMRPWMPISPCIDWFNDAIDAIEDKVLEKPSPTTLQRDF